jgi:mRNA-degrading endonuclease RelE of RelBE toxin-antitoxin system
VEASAPVVPYRVEIGPKVATQSARLGPAIGASLEHKILWLGQNAVGIIHRRLVNMPHELSGLCKPRVGDYRILYWVYHQSEVVRIYRVQHHSDVYRDI